MISSRVNVALEDWMTADGVADEVIKAVGLDSVEKTYKSVLHGVDGLGTSRGIALRVGKLKELGLQPKVDSEKQ